MFRRRGGNCPNTLEVLQQLLDGSKSSTSTSLALSTVLPASSSPATQEIKSSLGSAVDCTPCVYREQSNEPASSYIIRSCATDSRTIVNSNELQEMTNMEFRASLDKLEGAVKWCHFEAGSVQMMF